MGTSAAGGIQWSGNLGSGEDTGDHRVNVDAAMADASALAAKVAEQEKRV